MMSQRKTRQQSDREEDEPTEEELREKLKEYINFIDQVLEPQLKIAVSEREEIESEIKEYNELKRHLQLMVKTNGRSSDQGGAFSVTATAETDGRGGSDESLVDLGYGMIYCKAKILDPEHVFVHIGMGFHAEFTLEEAIQFIDRRIGHLTRNVQPGKVDKAREVGAHLENALKLLESLGREIRSTNDQKKCYL